MALNSSCQGEARHIGITFVRMFERLTQSYEGLAGLDSERIHLLTDCRQSSEQTLRSACWRFVNQLVDATDVAMVVAPQMSFADAMLKILPYQTSSRFLSIASNHIVVPGIE